MKKLTLLIPLIIVAMCAKPQGEDEQHSYPGLLQVCSDEVAVMEGYISEQDWWPMLVRHAKQSHPGHCLFGLNVVSLPDKLVIQYTMRSPDGSIISRDSFSYGNHTTSASVSAQR